MQEEVIRQNIYIYNKMVRWQWCKKKRKRKKESNIKVRDGEVNGIEEIHIYIIVRSRPSLQVWFFIILIIGSTLPRTINSAVHRTSATELRAMQV